MRRRSGFTLIEVLIASFVALVCMLIVVATMPLGTISRGKTDLVNRAMSLAQKELEAVKATGYPNLTPAQMLANGLIGSSTPVSTDTYTFTNVDNAAVDSPAQVLPTGTGTVTVTQVDIELRRVTVTVNWSDRGRARSVTLGTLVANL